MNPHAKPFVPSLAATRESNGVPAGDQSGHQPASSIITPNFPVSTQPRNGRRVLAMDVECVASGPNHLARSPCSVVIVDYWLNKVLHCIIKPAMPIFSYLTEITGFRQGDLDDGEPLEDVIKKVKAQLGPDVLLVGQSVKSDIAWMQLEEGVDYHSIGELSTAFGVFRPKYNSYSYFSLEHEALHLLGVDLARLGYHDPAEDAAASMELYKLFVEYGDSVTARALFNARQTLVSRPIRPSFAKRCNYSLDGVCMAAYNPQRCTCDLAPPRAAAGRGRIIRKKVSN